MDHLARGEKQPAASGNPNRAFLDYYGCLAEFARFQVREGVGREEGFFAFGSAICYGSSGANQPSHASPEQLADVSATSEIRRDGIALAFNPTEVADNLRWERYWPTGSDDRWLRSLYYLVRPALPFPVRQSIHRSVLSRRLRTPFPRWPVECSVELVFEGLMEQVLRARQGAEVPFIWFWPDGHQAALMMTHDVEHELGATHCDMLMDLDDSVGLKAAFQLVPEIRYECFEKLIADVRARGFEANLHDLDHDGRLYEDLGKFQRRAERINGYAKKYRLNGFRAGAMHRNQQWFELLGFQYEMSVPNVAHLEPQAGGCCSVSPFLVGNLLELPLTTAQDYGLFYILQQNSIDLWKQQIETIRSHHGLISFIVHPDYIVRPRERGLYRQLLTYLAETREEQDAWWALPGEINLWWRQRAGLRLSASGNAWRIEGPGKERARVAYARLENGKLEYRVEGSANLQMISLMARQNS
jgi:hypothetical protein